MLFRWQKLQDIEYWLSLSKAHLIFLVLGKLKLILKQLRQLPTDGAILSNVKQAGSNIDHCVCSPFVYMCVYLCKLYLLVASFQIRVS